MRAQRRRATTKTPRHKERQPSPNIHQRAPARYADNPPPPAHGTTPPKAAARPPAHPPPWRLPRRTEPRPPQQGPTPGQTRKPSKAPSGHSTLRTARAPQTAPHDGRTSPPTITHPGRIQGGRDRGYQAPRRVNPRGSASCAAGPETCVSAPARAGVPPAPGCFPAAPEESISIVSENSPRKTPNDKPERSLAICAPHRTRARGQQELRNRQQAPPSSTRSRLRSSHPVERGNRAT